MPWSVRKSEECPASKPWAVIKDSDGTVEGCHETEEAANAQQRALYANEGEMGMQHLQVKAVATVTDKGQFTAIAAAYSVDRVKERIIPGAFEKTIKAWRESGKNVPVHWDHQGEAENVIGYIDPATMDEREDGLYVEGQLDLKSSSVAREAWRSMKNNAVALSFGYLAKTRKGKNGVTELTEVDLFEISIVPGPANADTRLLSLKSAESDNDLRRRHFEHALAEALNAPVDRKKGDTSEIPKDRLLVLKQAEKIFAFLEANPKFIPKADALLKRAVELGETDEQFTDIAAVQALLDEKFPGHKIHKASEVQKSDADLLRKRTFDFALETAGGDPKARYVEPEPVPQPEPLDAAALRRQSDRAALDIALG